MLQIKLAVRQLLGARKYSVWYGIPTCRIGHSEIDVAYMDYRLTETTHCISDEEFVFREVETWTPNFTLVSTGVGCGTPKLQIL